MTKEEVELELKRLFNDTTMLVEKKNNDDLLREVFLRIKRIQSMKLGNDWIQEIVVNVTDHADMRQVASVVLDKFAKDHGDY